MRRVIPLVAIAAAAFAARFEVASIRPSAPSTTFCGVPTPSSLQLTMRGCTLRDFVVTAWSVESFNLFLPPDSSWISSTRYDISAKSSVPVALSDQGHMLGPVLEDRFRLKHHTEKRTVPVYFLAPLKSGLKLTTTKPGSCTAWDRKSPPPPPDPTHQPTCDYILYPGTNDGQGFGIDGTGVPMSDLVAHLAQLLERPVIDQTGYTGTFDIRLRFTRESVPRFANSPSHATEPVTEPTALPSIFTAFRGVGINIGSGKRPVDVFVVDSAQRPSEN